MPDNTSNQGQTFASFNQEFGQLISKKDADAIFDNARSIETEFNETIKSSLESDEAKAYFAEPHYGYVFSHEVLTDLFAKMDKDSFLVMLTGARDKVETDGVKLPRGRRTLIAMVYHQNGDTLVLDQTPLKSTTDKIGTQHPGTNKAKPSAAGVPVNIDDVDIVPMR
jgi:hypothetical protein